MATDKMWKIMIVGGSENGNEYSFPADKTVLIGRSRYQGVDTNQYAALQLGKKEKDKKEEDVSGKHLELFVKDDEAFVRNVSEHSVTLLNGSSKVARGECARVREGDTISMGRTVKVRLDEIPVDSPEPEEPVTGETRYFDPDALDQLPAAPVAETSMTSIESEFAVKEFLEDTGPVQKSEAGDRKEPDEESDTADPVPEPLPQNVPEEPGKDPHPVAPPPPGQIPRPSPSPISVRMSGPPILQSTQTSWQNPMTPADDKPTDVGGTSVSGMSLSGTASVPNDDPPTDDPNVGNKTEEIHTREVPPDVIIALKERLERKRKLRRVLMGIVLGTVFASAGAWWYLTRPKGEDGFTYPEPIREFGLRDESGAMLLKVDYPWNENADVTIAPQSNGVTVISAMGRDRDVPYFLQLESHSDPEELKIGLMESVARWFARTEKSALGFSFDERMKEELKPEFFEDVYPGSCQEKSLYGVRFVQFDYKRTWTADNQVWHGVGIYFRCGDTVYLLRREMPDSFWARGGYYLKIDSNLAIYKRYTDDYWESPGAARSLSSKPVEELSAAIRNSLDKDRPNDWRFVKKDIDSILVRSWRTDPNVRYRTLELLSRFREKQRVFYYQQYYAFQTEKENREDKKMIRIRQDAKIIFDNPDERYYFLIANGEVW